MYCYILLLFFSLSPYHDLLIGVPYAKLRAVLSLLLLFIIAIVNCNVIDDDRLEYKFRRLSVIFKNEKKVIVGRQIKFFW